MEEIRLAEAFVRAVAPWLAHIAEACSVLVILYGVIRALLAFVLAVGRTRGRAAPPTVIRLDLGRSLALGLEFLLAADILETAVAPSAEVLAELAAVAVIRTGLNYFLSKELEQEAKEVVESSAGETTPKPTGPAGTV